MSLSIEKAHEVLDSIWSEYIEDAYMQNKILTHMCSHLPSLMAQASDCHKQREDRKRNLTEAADGFISSFLSKHDYYYSSVAGMFFHYDGLHYSIYNEDDILYEALRGVTHKPELHAWKYKIKNNIVKRLKERHLLSCIPDSATIQNVVKTLYPAVFPNKTMVKYFLTVIGDGIHKKSENLIYLTSSDIKPFIQEIAAQANTVFGANTISASFKYKYYDHNFKDCRLIDSQSPINQKVWETGFQKHIVDLLCVASHYSHRYKSADAFAEQFKEQSTMQHARYLIDKTNETLIKDFIKNNIEIHAQDSGSIAYGEMVYLWKQHLTRKRVPNVIFNTPLRTTLLSQLAHDADTDSFTGVTSLHLPIVKRFMEFWETQVIDNEDESHLEIDELLTLLKHWNKKATSQLDATSILNMLKHFYPDVEVEDDKYVMMKECKIWNKRNHINDFLSAFRTKCLETNDMGGAPIPLFAVYEAYAKYSKQALLMASKTYFDKHLLEHMEEYIDEDKCIVAAWCE